jgi:hypothetical protein
LALGQKRQVRMVEFKSLKTEADLTEALKPLALDQNASLFLGVMKKTQK